MPAVVLHVSQAAEDRLMCLYCCAMVSCMGLLATSILTTPAFDNSILLAGRTLLTGQHVLCSLAQPHCVTMLHAPIGAEVVG